MLKQVQQDDEVKTRSPFELVEGPAFYFCEQAMQSFDKLRTNGICLDLGCRLQQTVLLQTMAQLIIGQPQRLGGCALVVPVAAGDAEKDSQSSS